MKTAFHFALSLYFLIAISGCSPQTESGLAACRPVDEIKFENGLIQIDPHRNFPCALAAINLVPFDPGMHVERQVQAAQYVVEVYEASNGDLWMGTMSRGAIRFDGDTTFTYYGTADGLPGQTISSFAEDRQGNLWVGGHQGVAIMQDTSFVTMWSSEGRHDSGTGWMSVAADREGTIWVNNNEGLFRYENEEFVRFELPIDVKNITEYSITPGKASLDLHDSKGNYWFGVDGYGILKYDGTQFTHFTAEDGLPSNNVTSILEDQAGDLWITCIQSYQPQMTNDGGLCKYDGKTFSTFSGMDALNNNDLYTIYEDSKGVVWIGATGTGVYRHEGEEFKLYEETNRMDLTYGMGLQAACEDRQGNLWFGFSGGLFKFEDDQILNVTLPMSAGC